MSWNRGETREKFSPKNGQVLKEKWGLEWHSLTLQSSTVWGQGGW